MAHMQQLLRLLSTGVLVIEELAPKFFLKL